MRFLLSAVALLVCSSAFAQTPDEGYATLQRVAIMVKDRPATVKFYRDVLGYVEESSGTGITLPPDHPLSLPPDAVLSMSYMKSRDGAYVALMGVDSKNLGTLDRPKGKANAYNDVILVHEVHNIAAIHKRAVAGGYEVLSAPTLSRSGKAMQMIMRDPNGVKIELNEMLKTAP